MLFEYLGASFFYTFEALCLGVSPFQKGAASGYGTTN